MAKSNPTNPSTPFSKRFDLMSAGLEELETWLLDTFRQGLASLEQQAPSFWTDIAARMVDAKLGGIARRLKRIGLLIGNEDKWYEKVLAELGNLYLLINAVRRIEDLPLPLQKDILSIAGVNTRKEDLLKEGHAIKDVWMILALTEKTEDNLRSRKTWLYGWKSNRFALVLDFAWGRSEFSERYIIGNVFEGTVLYYPSNVPIRVIVQEKRFLDNRPIKRIVGFAAFSDFLDHYATTLAANPWLLDYPCSLEQVSPTLFQERLYLLDKDNFQIPLLLPMDKQWKILALSGGHPVNLFGEWTGALFVPMSLSVNGLFFVL